MAVVNRPYGKDDPGRFISGALTGGSGESNGCVNKKIDRPDQSINTCVAMDNVKLAMPIESSMLDDGGWAGGITNLGHSLSGASAVQADTGAAGKTKKTIYPNH